MAKHSAFPALFRKFRLRSEFETLAEFGDTLAERGIVYDASIFSHWQKGSRIPKDRTVLLKVIALFAERGGIETPQDANALMSSVGLGYLTDAELSTLALRSPQRAPFQAPRLPEPFIERPVLLAAAATRLTAGGIVVLQGIAASGKTALAIRLAHLLRDEFPDGVLWLRCEQASMLSILHGLMQGLGGVFPPDIELDRAIELYRSEIGDRRTLIVFDGVTVETDIAALLPNSSRSAVIITAREPHPALPGLATIPVGMLADREARELMETIAGRDYMRTYRDDLERIITLVGNAPLPLAIIANQLASRLIGVRTVITELSESKDWLQDMAYGSTTLAASLSLSFSRLSTGEKRVLEICSFFDGIFHADAIAHAGNALPVSRLLNRLVRLSLLERVDDSRFQLHRVVRTFLQRKPAHPEYLPRLADWYTGYIASVRAEADFFVRMSVDVAAIVALLDATLEHGYSRAATALWREFGSYYWHVGAWQDVAAYSQRMETLAQEQNDIELQLSIFLEEVSRLYYYHGDVHTARAKAREALKLARKGASPRLAALAHQRYGKLCFMTGAVDEGKEHLAHAWKTYLELKDHLYLSHNYRYISEGYLLEGNIGSARFLLEQSRVAISRVPDRAYREIYESVILSHLGILAYIEGDLKRARQLFEEGLATAGSFPLVRGTYTWLNRFGLALTFRKLGFAAESRKLSEETLAEMERLGIEKSFPMINVYAWRLAEELRTYT
ncbi:MAG: NB-ARC domain-containing protein [Patescibacteria group bacterium]|nr:NB-ARC domain-containing protein [Patescibacteria group bacterium]